MLYCDFGNRYIHCSGTDIITDLFYWKHAISQSSILPHLAHKPELLAKSRSHIAFFVLFHPSNLGNPFMLMPMHAIYCQQIETFFLQFEKQFIFVPKAIPEIPLWKPQTLRNALVDSEGKVGTWIWIHWNGQNFDCIIAPLDINLSLSFLVFLVSGSIKCTSLPPLLCIVHLETWIQVYLSK